MKDLQLNQNQMQLDEVITLGRTIEFNIKETQHFGPLRLIMADFLIKRQIKKFEGLIKSLSQRQTIVLTRILYGIAYGYLNAGSMGDEHLVSFAKKMMEPRGLKFHKKMVERGFDLELIEINEATKQELNTLE